MNYIILLALAVGLLIAAIVITKREKKKTISNRIIEYVTFDNVIDFAQIFYTEDSELMTAQMFKEELIDVHLVIPDNYEIVNIKLKRKDWQVKLIYATLRLTM